LEAPPSPLLPLSGAPVPPEKPLEDGLLRGSETMLLVDDEEMILDVGRAMHDKPGYRVLPPAGGKQAAMVAESGEDIDLVILERIIPELSREVRSVLDAAEGGGHAPARENRCH